MSHPSKRTSNPPVVQVLQESGKRKRAKIKTAK